MRRLAVATGAWSTGKSTTLARVAEVSSVRVHPEAYRQVLEQLGPKREGHPPDRPFSRVDAPDHLCPMCEPRAFAALVLARQRELERGAHCGDLLERSVIDSVELFERTCGADRAALAVPEAQGTVYGPVLLFEVMPELQRPRWGKTAARRLEEAREVSARLEGAYRAAGYDPVTISAGTVDDRALAVLAALGRGELPRDDP
jgi:predicted ATPase